MKRLLILAGEDVIVRNILFTDFLSHLKTIYSGEIVIAVKADRVEYMRAALPGYTFVPFKHSGFSIVDRAFGWALLKASNTETMQWLTWNAHYMGIRSLWKVLLDRAYEHTLGRSALVKHFLRYFYLRVGSDKNAQKLLNDTKPDAVFALSLTNFDFDVPIAREAKRQRLHFIAMVRSWDALVTHGALRVVPDVFILQNEFLRKTGKLHQALPDGLFEKLPVGLPHYDFAHRGDLENREETFRRVGLDPAKRLVVYGAMGDSFRYESQLFPLFENMLQSGQLPSDVQFLYRPHPATSKLGRAELSQGSRVIIDKTVGFVNEQNPRDDARGAAVRKLFSLIAHTDVVMTAGSTFALDAAALGKPVICLDFEAPGAPKQYWLSVKAVYDYFTHFIDYVKTGAAEIVEAAEDLPKAVNDALKRPDARKDGIERAIAEFLAPYDGKAGRRLAERLLEELT